MKWSKLLSLPPERTRLAEAKASGFDELGLYCNSLVEYTIRIDYNMLDRG